MNPKLTGVFVVVLFILFFGGRFVKTIPPGHVGVAALFGSVQKQAYPEGLQFPVNPLYAWYLFDTRQKTLKEVAQVPTRDQLQTKVDLSVQYKVDAAMAPIILQETGDAAATVTVHLVPKLRSLIRELGTKIERAEDFFLEEVRELLETELTLGLQEYLLPKGIVVQAVLIRDVNLPTVLSNAIELKKEREQKVEQQKAELERFKTEQQQFVVEAEAQRQAAEEQARTKRILADAKAYEIQAINNAASKSPVYVQLQSLEALKQMSKDPAAKLYFMDGASNNPLPLLHMGDMPK